MNIRKPTDYSMLFSALDMLMCQNLQPLELFLAVGQEIDSRPEKGAAVAASEYLQNTYPEISGFSPRNVRRMREFFRAYKSNPALMAEALKISWTHNVLIFEKCHSEQEQLWYIRAVQQFGWSKQTLLEKITHSAYQEPMENEQESTQQSAGKRQKKLSPLHWLVRKVLKWMRRINCGTSTFIWTQRTDIDRHYLQGKNPPNCGAIFRMCGA